MRAGDRHREVFPGEAVKAETRKSSKSQGEEDGGVACEKACCRASPKKQGDEAGRTQRRGHGGSGKVGGVIMHEALHAHLSFHTETGKSVFSKKTMIQHYVI